MTVIRTRTSADLPRCVQVLAAVHAYDGYPSRWPAEPSNWLGPKDLHSAWVALVGRHPSQIVGHVGMSHPFDAPALVTATGRPAGELAGVIRLFVAPDARRGGVAEQLLTTATDHIRRQGWLPVLDVVESSTPAIALYERLGWRYVTSEPARWVDRTGDHPTIRYYVATD